MKKQRFVSFCAALIGLFAVMSVLFACSDGEMSEETFPEETYGGLPEYDVENIESYIKPFEYKGLTVTLAEGETAQEKLWVEISENVEIISYPEAQVNYYAEQERAKYRYFASRDGIEYDKILEGLGVTEESIILSAKALVKVDLILEYIIKDAGIVLSDEEKQLHFDKYAEKYVEIYGYNREYVSANMAEQIYGSMLYDKTMEFLVLNNTVQTNQSK